LKNKLTQEYLKECLDYDPETGILKWKKRPIEHFKRECDSKSWNTRYANKKAGCLNDGYLTVKVDGKRYYAHRIIYCLCHGYFPEHGIDHINRNRSDNRIENLREANQQCNLRNKSKHSNNKSGVTGVSWYKKANKWISNISANDKQINLGYYEIFNDAVKSRWEAEVKYNFPNCNSSSLAYNYLKENNLI